MNKYKVKGFAKVKINSNTSLIGVAHAAVKSRCIKAAGLSVVSQSQLSFSTDNIYEEKLANLRS